MNANPLDIIQVKVPLPFPLRWVNSYLIRGSGGFTLIDPGLHTEKAVSHWETTLTEKGIQYQDIEQIVLTHHHPDHYGLAGWFQEKTGAPVCLSQRGYDQALRLWGEDQLLTEEIYRLFLRHGMDKAAAAQLLPHMSHFTAWVSPQPEVSILQPATSFRLGDHWFETIETPGHAAGHLCFYEPNSRQMFCGDHVLPMISPNVSYIPGVDENPLHSFLASLETIGQYEVTRAYPGHRDPFHNFAQRTKELILHHEERLNVMQTHLQLPMNAYQLCLTVFGRTLTIHQLRFAMSETIAHLFYLREQRRVREYELGGVIWYQAR